MNTKRVPGIVIGIVILALAIWWIITPRTSAPTDVAQEDVAIEYETVTAEQYGLEFAYRVEPEPYRVRGHGRGDDELTNFEYRYELMLESAYEELQSSDVAREAPPTITVTIYNNPDELDPTSWGAHMGQFADLDTILDEPDVVSVNGVEGTQYTADGLYVADVAWVADGDFLYRFAGEYLDDRDDIRDDFWYLIDSVQLLN